MSTHPAEFLGGGFQTLLRSDFRVNHWSLRGNGGLGGGMFVIVIVVLCVGGSGFCDCSGGGGFWSVDLGMGVLWIMGL